MKTIIHYKNGQSYTINDLFINWTDWEGGDVTISGELLGKIEKIDKYGLEWNKSCIKFFQDALYIEEIDKECGVVKIHFNPDVEMSVKVDVMTAKQRSKANRSSILSTLGKTRKTLKNIGW